MLARMNARVSTGVGRGVSRLARSLSLAASVPPPARALVLQSSSPSKSRHASNTTLTSLFHLLYLMAARNWRARFLSRALRLAQVETLSLVRSLACRLIMRAPSMQGRPVCQPREQFSLSFVLLSSPVNMVSSSASRQLASLLTCSARSHRRWPKQ